MKRPLIFNWLIMSAVLVIFLLSGCAEPPGDKAYYFNYQKKDAAWFGSPEAVKIADNFLSYQFHNGGWSKNIDMVSRSRHFYEKKEREWPGFVIFDNQATTSQLFFLIRVYQQTKKVRFKTAFLKGLALVLKSQYSSGGWPSKFPLTKNIIDFRDYVTFNDDVQAMMLRLLYFIQQEPYSRLLTARQLKKAKTAFDKGLEYVIKSQITQNGVKTGWCQQHDPFTYEPRPGRVYEPAALVSLETADLINFLMNLPDPDPQVILAINQAALWLKKVSLHDENLKKYLQPKKMISLVQKNFSVWARFYDLKTNQPLFVNRYGQKKTRITQIETFLAKRYDWYVTTPARVLVKWESWTKRENLKRQ